MSTRIALPPAILFAAALLQHGCAHHIPLVAAMEPLRIDAAAPLEQDHFARDRPSALSEEGLRAILEAPIELDRTQRLGVLPVAAAYRPDRLLPLPAVPAELTRALEATGLFQGITEMSTDWPADGDIPGLRELAARYRSRYLLLYRQRFVDDAYANAWSWLYLTGIGIFLAPSRTLTTAGVLEATLFDVRTGTLLFTVYERVRASSDETPFADDRKLEGLRQRLLREAAGTLAESVVSKVRRLAGPREAAKVAELSAPPTPPAAGSSDPASP